MKDYEITVKVRNNYLLTAMRAKGYQTAPDLWRACGVDRGTIYDYLNLKKIPLTRSGEWRKSILTIADCLGVEPASLFPFQHIEQALLKNTASFEGSIHDLADLGDYLQAPLLPDAGLEEREMAKAIGSALDELIPRDKYILEQRFGLTGVERTLEDIGNELGISRDRVRQIEGRGLRRLKYPSRARALKEAATFELD